MNTVAAVVVTFNRLSLLIKCLEALKTQSRVPDLIIVVNNGSDDGTASWLNEQPDLFIIHQENLGGAGGFHRGMKEAYLQGFDGVWIMDDDVVPTKNALEALTDSLTFGDFGFVCSRVVGLNGVSMNSPSIDYRPGVNHYPTWDEYLNESFVKVIDATFVSVLVPMQNVCAVGLPLKEMFIWGDDKEYTLRLTLNKPALMVGKSVVYHHRTIQKTIDIQNELNRSRLKMFFYSIRNSLYIERKYSSPTGLAKLLYVHLKALIRSVLAFNFYSTKIIIKGILAGLVFNPVIEYVKR